VLAVAWLAAAGIATHAENIDPAGDDHQFAWGENVGWVNAEPQGDGGPGAQIADFVLGGWLWGENIGWISLSCANTSSCGATPYGVTNDGFGRLSGFAWSENAGWIDFDPTLCEPDPTCGVTIDPTTGYFAGRAWGENIGWVSFSPGNPLPSTARTSWCQATPPPPGAGIVLRAGSSGGQLGLSWSPQQAASWYDVVRGGLSSLRSSGGDYSVATQACLAEKLGGTSVFLAEPDPPPGEGLWYLVRGANCKGHGTYDTGLVSQAAPRDAGIAASSVDCP
jgi:hypothetical protein